MVVCCAFISCRVLTLIRYIQEDFRFGPRDYVRQIEDFITSRFVIWRLCSIHFTVTLAGLKNIVRYIEDFVNRCSFVLHLVTDLFRLFYFELWRNFAEFAIFVVFAKFATFIEPFSFAHFLIS